MRARTLYDTPINHTICFPLVETVWLVSKNPEWDAVGWARGPFSSLENDLPPTLTSTLPPLPQSGRLAAPEGHDFLSHSS